LSNFVLFIIWLLSILIIILTLILVSISYQHYFLHLKYIYCEIKKYSIENEEIKRKPSLMEKILYIKKINLNPSINEDDIIAKELKNKMNYKNRVINKIVVVLILLIILWFLTIFISRYF
jgi:hypothetical protein